MNHQELLARITAVAHEAGAAAMEVYATDFEVRGKADRSPVTEADDRAEAVILERLAALTPDIPVISEEQAAAGLAPQAGERFWLGQPPRRTPQVIQPQCEVTIKHAVIP